MKTIILETFIFETCISKPLFIHFNFFGNIYLETFRDFGKTFETFRNLKKDDFLENVCTKSKLGESKRRKQKQTLGVAHGQKVRM